MLHLQEARKVFRKKVQDLKDEGRGDRNILVAFAHDFFGVEVGVEEVRNAFDSHEVDLALKPMDDKDE